MVGYNKGVHVIKTKLPFDKKVEKEETTQGFDSESNK